MTTTCFSELLCNDLTLPFLFSRGSSGSLILALFSPLWLLLRNLSLLNLYRCRLVVRFGGAFFLAPIVCFTVFLLTGRTLEYLYF